MNIYVGNLSYNTSEGNLETMFGEFGAVESVRIITDRETGRSKGFAFVDMPDDQEALAAIEALNGQEIDGRTLRVNEARPKMEGGGGRNGGGRRGGFGGGRQRF
ncbi:RNA-binding protein [bacterium]|nr:RNA-binding protein [candidate division CSSED10-310 bacterium]